MGKNLQVTVAMQGLIKFTLKLQSDCNFDNFRNCMQIVRQEVILAPFLIVIFSANKIRSFYF